MTIAAVRKAFGDEDVENQSQAVVVRFHAFVLALVAVFYNDIDVWDVLMIRFFFSEVFVAGSDTDISCHCSG